MARYQVSVKFQVWGVFNIEANDQEHAERIVERMDTEEIREKCYERIPWTAMIDDIQIEENPE